MVEAGETFHPSVTIVEDTAGGTAPDFQEQGLGVPTACRWSRPGATPRAWCRRASAVEFEAPTNGATAQESPVSLDVAAGDLPAEDALKRLGSGIHVSNLHHLNYSDRTAAAPPA